MEKSTLAYSSNLSSHEDNSIPKIHNSWTKWTLSCDSYFPSFDISITWKRGSLQPNATLWFMAYPKGEATDNHLLFQNGRTSCSLGTSSCTPSILQLNLCLLVSQSPTVPESAIFYIFPFLELSFT